MIPTVGNQSQVHNFSVVVTRTYFVCALPLLRAQENGRSTWGRLKRFLTTCGFLTFTVSKDDQFISPSTHERTGFWVPGHSHCFFLGVVPPVANLCYDKTLWLALDPQQSSAYSSQCAVIKTTSDLGGKYKSRNFGHFHESGVPNSWPTEFFVLNCLIISRTKIIWKLFITS